MKKVTDAFLDFSTGCSYDNLPPEVLHISKRILLDGIGNALGGLASDKGKIGISMAHKMGGHPESTVIGVGDKVSAPVAAFANSELLNGLDMDPIPHIPPIVLPALLAVAEAERSSGKELLTSLTVAQEISFRLVNSLGSVMLKSLIKYGKTPDVFGNSNEIIIGAAVGNALLMKLPREKIAQAMGISAYLCSLPVCRDWESTMPKSMIKYAPVSWLAQGSVQSAMLAREGYTGNAYTLDSEYGFPVFYAKDSDVWDPEKVIEGLGEKWMIQNYDLKPYPCCRFLHSILDAFYALKSKHKLNADDIDAIRCYTSSFVAHPDQYFVSNQIDAQFSGPYNIALAALNYKPGPAWQDKNALSDPEVHKLMKKVSMFVAPEYVEHKKKHHLAWYGRVEVDIHGETLVETNIFPKGIGMKGYALTDEELKDRFRTCASVVLTESKIEKAIELIMNIEKLDSLDPLFENITL